MNYLEVSITMLAAALCCWLEVKRRDSKRLFLRLFAVLAACFSLFTLLHPAPKKSGEALFVLGEGFSADSLREWKTRFQRGKTGFRIASAEKLKPLRLEKSSEIHLFGYLNDTSLLRGCAHKRVFLHSSPPTGLVYAKWQRSVYVGESVTVRGIYEGSKNSAPHLKLCVFGRCFDSCVCAPGVPFSLKAPVLTPGRTIYALREFGEGAEEHPCPVEVVPAKASPIVILGAPSFENKFLKDKLSSVGYSVSYRFLTGSTTSNSGPGLTKITRDELKKLQVVVLDMSAYRLLAQNEQQNLLAAVRDGLGVVARLDSAGSQVAFMGLSLKLLQAKKQSLVFFDGDSAKYPLSTPVDMGLQVPFRSVLQDKTGGCFAVKTKVGQGSVVVCSFGDTFPWLLEGHTGRYIDFWKHLFTYAFRDETTKPPVSFPLFAFNNKSMSITSTGSQPLFSSLNEHINVSKTAEGLFEGRYWPKSTGWQWFSQDGHLNFWTYVFAEADWRSVRLMASFQNVRHWIQIPRAIISDKNNVTGRQIPKTWLLVFFLIAVIFLFVERKFALK